MSTTSAPLRCSCHLRSGPASNVARASKVPFKQLVFLPALCLHPSIHSPSAPLTPLAALDHELDAHARHTEESGRYTLFLLGTPHGTGQRAVGPVEEWVVGARRHAWLVTTLPLAGGSSFLSPLLCAPSALTNTRVLDPLRVAAGAQRVVENYFAIPIETEAQQNKTHQFHLVWDKALFFCISAFDVEVE